MVGILDVFLLLGIGGRWDIGILLLLLMDRGFHGGFGSRDVENV